MRMRGFFMTASTKRPGIDLWSKPQGRKPIRSNGGPPEPHASVSFGERGRGVNRPVINTGVRRPDPQRASWQSLVYTRAHGPIVTSGVAQLPAEMCPCPLFQLPRPRGPHTDDCATADTLPHRCLGSLVPGNSDTCPC